MTLASRFFWLFCGLAVCCSATARADDQPRPDLVFLLIGQSNMAGRAPLAAGDDAVFPGAWLLNDKAEWEPAQNPLNRYASNRKELSMQRISPGDGVLRRLREALPKKRIGIISNARGGSSIEEWAADQPLYVLRPDVH